MKNEALERSLMGAEDADALDMEQMQRQREQGEASSWQVYCDESTDPPTPWWFNSVTGVSTWECPNVVDDDNGTAYDDPLSTNATGKSHLLGCRLQNQRTVVTG